VVGYNYRMTNIEAAIGLAQLERADEFIAKKRALAKRYAEGLEGLPVVVHGEQAGTVHSYWMVSILVDHADQRDPLREHLKARGIETRPLFYPVHTMPMYSRNYRKHPVAENLAWRGINLPSWPGLSDAQSNEVMQAIREFFDRAA
jgi:perosamine synthetase